MRHRFKIVVLGILTAFVGSGVPTYADERCWEDPVRAHTVGGQLETL